MVRWLTILILLKIVINMPFLHTFQSFTRIMSCVTFFLIRTLSHAGSNLFDPGFKLKTVGWVGYLYDGTKSALFWHTIMHFVLFIISRNKLSYKRKLFFSCLTTYRRERALGGSKKSKVFLFLWRKMTWGLYCERSLTLINTFLEVRS